MTTERKLSTWVSAGYPQADISLQFSPLWTISKMTEKEPGMSELNLSKYENAVLYLCSKIQNKTIRGKKKLAKLLYYVDFDRFEFNESMETVTGDQYTRLPMGPVPKAMNKVVAGMTERGLLKVTEAENASGYRPTTVYMAQAEPDMSLFDKQDIAILERVGRMYLNLSGKQIEDLSHEEAPWLAMEHKDTIPFELAFYRDTDFSNAA